MPTVAHEMPLLLFRERPDLVPRLLHDSLGIPVPAHANVRIEDAEFTQLVPTPYHADLVVTLADGAGETVMGIVVEIQLATDRRKHRSWPVYAAALHAKLGCPTYLVVVATTEEVALWAAQPIATFQPGCSFAPVVLGPDRIPVVASSIEAERCPELAVLSSLAHGRGEHAREIASAALSAATHLDEQRRALYIDTVLHSISGALRKALEFAMDIKDYQNYEFKSPIFKDQIDRGVARGVAQGEARGRAQAVLTFLQARNLPVTDDQRARILACTDLPTLDRWAARAATAASAEDVLAAR
jgi:hypothetical protein